MQAIRKVNGVDIIIADQQGEKLIPIKPICEALGIAANMQIEKIKNDEILSSVSMLGISTGSDGKQYEMFSLPHKYVYGWLFTINPKNVKEEARGAVLKYRQECYDALYDHFYLGIQKQLNSNEAEIKLLQELNTIGEEKRKLGDREKAIRKNLEKVRSERLDAQLSLFDTKN